VTYKKAQGTYLAWLDVSEVAEAIGATQTAEQESVNSVAPVAPEDVLQRWFAENAGVFLGPGNDYGLGGAGRMRMNLATPRQQIRGALDNMADALAHI